MLTRVRSLLPIAIISLFPTFLIWLPFFLRVERFWRIPLPEAGMATIVANYDGPLFIVVAKTLYDKALIAQNYQFPLPTEYYASHFPLFPILIRLSAYLVGFPYALLGVTLASSILAIHFFNKFIKEFVGERNALWITFVFSILPVRWLIVRSVGSAEPLFLAAVIASVYYFRRRSFWLAAIWGVVAQLTKSAGILLFVAYSGSLIFPKLKNLAIEPFAKWLKSMNLRRIYPILLIPISLLGLFIYYKIQFNDFLAYFHSGDNIHLFFPPFQVFDYSAPWVGTFWLEEIIFIYLFGILGLLALIKQKRTVLAWFVGIFFASTLFVSHRDVLRYSLPIVPFLFAAWADTITRKDFKVVIWLLIIPIYLFSLAYISQNVMPIADWAPFL
jgi:Gpi18-like mannosyltransferase